jgi:glycosyltransferase involved in cell wall biosynthesis
MTIDLIIPCYNPSKGWEKNLCKKYAELINYFNGDESAINLIVVNDGSIYNFSVDEIEFLRAHIPGIVIIDYTQNKGKGFAVRSAVKISMRNYCIYCDYDFPYGTQVIYQIFKKLQEGVDIVTGCREMSNYEHKASFKRRFISNALIRMNRLLFSLPVNDTQAGVKGFNSLGKSMLLQTSIDRFLFDMEFILIASRNPDIIIRPITVTTCDDLLLTNFSAKTILHEIKNLFTLFFKKHGSRSGKPVIEYSGSTTKSVLR